MKKLKRKNKIDFLMIFLVLDLFIVFVFVKTSNASYTSTAVSTAEMDVALYTFNYNGMNETSSSGETVQSLDVNLGDIGPGETKYYKFSVSNTDENGNVADTNIVYQLKVITTTNISKLNYKLYYNTVPSSSNATDAFESSALETDSLGTWYKTFTVAEKCLKYDETNVDSYILAVSLDDSAISSSYQDLIESIKIQLTSKQLLDDDNSSVCSG